MHKCLRIAATLLFMITMPIHGKTLMTAVCQEPSGQRMDFGGLLAKQTGKDLNFSTDGFTDVNPIFRIDDTDQKKLAYLFANTKGSAEFGIAQRGFRSAYIVLASVDVISAIETSADTIAIFSLYPRAGVGFFTYHEANPISGADAKSVTFFAKCSFKDGG